MIEVTVFDRDPGEIMEIVRLLRQQGMMQGRDFDFVYHPAKSDPITGHWLSRYTVFCFYTEKYATLFALKYGS